MPARMRPRRRRTTGAAATTTAGGTESTAGSADQGRGDDRRRNDHRGERDRRRERPGFSRSRETFAYANPGGVNQWDPHRVVNAIDAIFMRQVYDRVLSFDQTPTSVELAPQLATSWEIADDGMSITFEFRDDVTFQDGTKFDATAFKANMDRAMGPDSTVAARSVQCGQRRRRRPHPRGVPAEQPDPSIPWALAFGSTGMMASPAAFDTLATQPVASGPFKLVSWAKDADVVYERWTTTGTRTPRSSPA